MGRVELTGPQATDSMWYAKSAAGWFRADAVEGQRKSPMASPGRLTPLP